MTAGGPFEADGSFIGHDGRAWRPAGELRAGDVVRMASRPGGRRFRVEVERVEDLGGGRVLVLGLLCFAVDAPEGRNYRGKFSSLQLASAWFSTEGTK